MFRCQDCNLVYQMHGSLSHTFRYGIWHVRLSQKQFFPSSLVMNFPLRKWALESCKCAFSLGPLGVGVGPQQIRKESRQKLPVLCSTSSALYYFTHVNQEQVTCPLHELSNLQEETIQFVFLCFFKGWGSFDPFPPDNQKRKFVLEAIIFAPRTNEGASWGKETTLAVSI